MALLSDAVDRVRDALDEGEPTVIKHLLRQFIHRIEISPDWEAHPTYRSLIPDVRQVWLQAQPGSDEAALDEAGLVLDFLQAVPDDLDQVGSPGR